MLYLIASIIFATSINIILRYFRKWEVDTFQSIVFNYWTCALFGFLSLFYSSSSINIAFQGEWLPYSLILGLIFIIGFNVAAATIRFYGITIATIMQKISLIFSVIYAITIFGESSHIMKIVGVVIALPAIILININNNKHAHHHEKSFSKWLFLLPLFILLISGFIEICFFHVQKSGLLDGNDLAFSTMIFFTASVIGTIFWLIKDRKAFQFKNLKAGIILGLPNFGSIYFLLKALDSVMEGSVVIPLNNIAILLLSGLAGWFLFKERFTVLNFFGFSLAIISILLISLA